MLRNYATWRLIARRTSIPRLACAGTHTLPSICKRHRSDTPWVFRSHSLIGNAFQLFQLDCKCSENGTAVMPWPGNLGQRGQWLDWKQGATHMPLGYFNENGNITSWHLVFSATATHYPKTGQWQTSPQKQVDRHAQRARRHVPGTSR